MKKTTAVLLSCAMIFSLSSCEANKENYGEITTSSDMKTQIIDVEENILGTGKEKPQDYKPIPRESTAVFYDLPSDPMSISGFANKTLEQEVNDWVRATVRELRGDDITETIDLQAWAKNGYLNVTTTIYDTANGMYDENGEVYYFYCRAAVFDMHDGKRVENFSDMFYKDADFWPILAEHLSLYFGDPSENNYEDELKGILDDINDFTTDTIFFHEDSPYFLVNGLVNTTVFFSIEELRTLMPCSEYFDNTPLFESDAMIEIFDMDLVEYVEEFYINEENGVEYGRISSSIYLEDEEIEKLNADFKLVQDKATEKYGFERMYVRTSHPKIISIFEDAPTFCTRTILYDKETLQEITTDEYFYEGWERESIETLYDQNITDFDDEFVAYIDVQMTENFCVVMYGAYVNGEANYVYYREVPIECVRAEYRVFNDN